MSMWEPFTERARRCIVLAQEEAQRLSHGYMGTEHILLGIVNEGECIAAKALEPLGVNLARVRAEVEAIVGRGSHKLPIEMAFTPHAKHVIELAFEEARQLNVNYIGTEHLLLGIVREREGVGAKVLAKVGVGADQIRPAILGLLESGQTEPIAGAARTGTVQTTLGTIGGQPGALPPGRMSITAAHAVMAAKEAAMRRGRRIYDADHLLYGIAHLEESRAARILAEHNVTPQRIRQHLGNATENLELDAREIVASAAAQVCMQAAFAKLTSMSRLMLDSETLLLAMIEDADNRAFEILKALGADIDRIRTQLKEVLYGRNS